MWMEGPLGNNAVSSLSHSHRKKETSDVKRLTFNRKCGEDDKAPGSGLTTCPGRHTAAYRLPLTWACVIRVEFPGIGDIFSCPLPELNLPPTMSESLIKRHPLQRLPSPSRGISALVHVSALVPWFGLPLRSMADTLRWRVLRAFSGLSSCMYYDCNTRSTSEESMTNEFQACMKIPIRRRWSLQSKNFVDNWC